MLIRILVLVEPAARRRRLEQLLAPLDAVSVAAPTRGEIWQQLRSHNADLVLVGRANLPDPVPQSVSAIEQLPDEPDVVVLLDDDDSQEAARLLVAGCAAAISTRLPDALLRDTLAALVRRRQAWATERLASRLSDAPPRLNDFASSSPLMRAFLDTVRRVVATDSTLLLLGESGVGKERLARAIHAESGRSAGPFIAVNCGALPETLLESELFGHEEGAFTGATRARRGYFELAHRGTIFLDEIAELPLHLQVKLLRVLQERTVQRLGGESLVPIDVRVMAATNRDLVELIATRQFRQDLYYRLGVVTLEVPPLRQRREDIPLLLESHLEDFCVRFAREPRTFAPDAMEALVAYSWPGNVRELINVVERAVLLAPAREIATSDLPRSICEQRGGWLAAAGTDDAFQSATAQMAGENWLALPLRAVRRSMIDAGERAYLAALLAACQGRIGETARRAGITPRALSSKMRRLGLRKETYRGHDGRGAGDENAERDAQR